MAKKDKFVEMKIRLVMKLRRMSRAAAVAEIARMDAARKKAEGAETRDEDDLFDAVEPSVVRASGAGRRPLTAEEFLLGE